MFALQFVVATLCGWLRQKQEEVIAFLREENAVLRRGWRDDALDCPRHRVSAANQAVFDRFRGTAMRRVNDVRVDAERRRNTRVPELLLRLGRTVC